MEETVRYNYRLRPGVQAQRALLEEWGRCRWLWNEAVHQQKSGHKPTYAKLSRLLTEARKANAWLRAGSQVAQQQMLRTYGQALDRSFKVKGCRRPVLKHRKTARPSLEYTTRGFSVKAGRLYLPKGVSIPVVWSRELPSAPTSVRVFRDSLGHWYASFVVTREIAPVPEASASIGIDWGVKTTATTTDPTYDLPYGGHRRKSAALLARFQRQMARRQRPRGHVPSKGCREARLNAAKTYKKAARQNAHASRVWARRVVDDHQVIAVEDFRSLFLAKSTMARKSADAAIGIAKRELIERGKRAGRKVVMVQPAYTTMTCAECGTRAKERISLSERTFRCATCGHTADRDRNAARVILAMAERGHAGADDIRQLSQLPPGSRAECGLSQESPGLQP